MSNNSKDNSGFAQRYVARSSNIFDVAEGLVDALAAAPVLNKRHALEIDRGSRPVNTGYAMLLAMAYQKATGEEHDAHRIHHPLDDKSVTVVEIPAETLDTEKMKQALREMHRHVSQAISDTVQHIQLMKRPAGFRAILYDTREQAVDDWKLLLAVSHTLGEVEACKEPIYSGMHSAKKHIIFLREGAFSAIRHNENVAAKS